MRKKNDNYRIKPEELQNLIYGPDSLLKLFADTYGLNYLVQDINITVIESLKFQVYATIDPDDGVSDLISITTGTFRTLKKYAVRASSLLQSVNEKPWTLFGWVKKDFLNIEEFEDYLTKTIFDFLLLHELGHLIRGHINYYMQLTQRPLSENQNSDTNKVLNIRRIALELDADSIALYHIVSLSDFLLKESKLYSRAKNISIYIKFIGFATKMLYAILSELRGDSKNKISKNVTLDTYHKKLTHPHPSVREEFSTQRIIQLAKDAKEKTKFKNYLNKSYAIFINLVGENLFSLESMESWLREPKELELFLNSIIDEIQLAEEMGWIVNDTRLRKAIKALTPTINL